MRELDEDSVRVGWMQAGEMEESEMMEAMQSMVDEQPNLLAWLTPEDSPSEVDEVILQLALTTWLIVVQRDGKARPLPVVEGDLLERLAAKRRSTVGDYLAGKQARDLSLDEALETVAERESLPQWALLGHLAEALLDWHEHEEGGRADAESAFVRLAIVVEAVDRVVKS